jgi:phasin family protein
MEIMMTAKKITRTAKPAKPAAAELTKTIETAVGAGKEIVVKGSADTATKGVDKAIAMSKEQVNAAAKARTQVLKSYEDVVGFGKESIDAVVTANVILMKGLQDLNTQFFDITTFSLEKNVEANKKLFTCKTPEEFFALQNDLVKANYDDVLVEFQKMSNLSVKVADDFFAPIGKQVDAAVEKITKQLVA